MNERDIIVAKHFLTAYVLYAGFSEVWGCGYQDALNEDNGVCLNVKDEEPNNNFRKSMFQLLKYVENVIQKGGKVELFAS